MFFADPMILPKPVARPVAWGRGSASAAKRPALPRTGNPVVDEQHAQIQACLAGLQRICNFHEMRRTSCARCTVEMSERCESDLVALLGDLLAFIMDHYMTESAMVRKFADAGLDRALSESRLQDHADIAATVQQLIGRLGEQETVGLIHELDNLTQRWMEHHVLLHDRGFERHVAEVACHHD